MTDRPGVQGKHVVITGATGGIGLAAAEDLAAGGANLAIVARNPQRARDAVARIRARAGESAVVDVLHADLSSQASIRELAGEILARQPRIDVLVNNAGAIYAERQMTAEGFEMTWALNHLAPFLLTSLLLDRIRASAPARIVTTSSGAHKGAHIPFDDLAADRSYRLNGFARYGQTKLANILFTTELARRLAGTGVTANCFHPGLVSTGFGRNNGGLMGLAMRAIAPLARSPEKGAETLVWLVESADVAGETGGYFFDRRRIEPSRAARDQDVAGHLWETTTTQTQGVAAARV